MEHGRVADSIVPVGKAAEMVGGGQPGVRLFLNGSDTDNPAILIGVLGAVRSDDKDGEEYPCVVPTPDHKEAGKPSI